MAEEKKVKTLSMTNTKKEMIDAYQLLLKQLQEKKEAELKPEKVVEEKSKKEAVQIAENLSSEGVIKEIAHLKLEIGKKLTSITDGLEEEVHKFNQIRKAIQVKDEELRELYEIHRSSETLAALIEAQNQKRIQFEQEMDMLKKELEEEITKTRDVWQKEKEEHAAEIRQRDASNAKAREREKEEYDYAFQREKALAEDRFEDEKAKVEKEVHQKRQYIDNELAAREKTVTEKEEELQALQEKVQSFSDEIDQSVQKAMEETAKKLNAEAKNREEFLKKEFEGEKKVLQTKIDSLEKTLQDQNLQIAALSAQLEKSYQKVQDIAMKSIEGASNWKVAAASPIAQESPRTTPQEK